MTKFELIEMLDRLNSDEKIYVLERDGGVVEAIELHRYDDGRWTLL